MPGLTLFSTLHLSNNSYECLFTCSEETRSIPGFAQYTNFWFSALIYHTGFKEMSSEVCDTVSADV